jgi:hypothetical protein
VPIKMQFDISNYELNYRARNYFKGTESSQQPIIVSKEFKENNKELAKMNEISNLNRMNMNLNSIMAYEYE